MDRHILRAGALADRTEDDLADELTSLRIPLVPLGVTVTFGHVLVYQFGRELVFRARILNREPPLPEPVGDGGRHAEPAGAADL